MHPSNLYYTGILLQNTSITCIPFTLNQQLYISHRSKTASLHIYIIQSSDTNVKACGCDSLHRTITKLSFLLF